MNTFSIETPKATSLPAVTPWGRGSAVQIKGASFIISNIKSNPQQVIITDYSVDLILFGLTLDDVTVHEWRTSHYCFLYLLFFKKKSVSLLIKEGAGKLSSTQR